MKIEEIKDQTSVEEAAAKLVSGVVMVRPSGLAQVFHKASGDAYSMDLVLTFSRVHEDGHLFGYCHSEPLEVWERGIGVYLRDPEYPLTPQEARDALMVGKIIKSKGQCLHILGKVSTPYKGLSGDVVFEIDTSDFEDGDFSELYVSDAVDSFEFVDGAYAIYTQKKEKETEGLDFDPDAEEPKE